MSGTLGIASIGSLAKPVGRFEAGITFGLWVTRDINNRDQIDLVSLLSSATLVYWSVPSAKFPMARHAQEMQMTATQVQLGQCWSFCQ